MHCSHVFIKIRQDLKIDRYERILHTFHIYFNLNLYLIANFTFFPDTFMNHGYVRFQAGSGRHFFKKKISFDSSPCCKYFVAVRTRITVVLDAFVDDLYVPVEMTLLAEHFVTYWTRGWLVDLDVEMNLQKRGVMFLCEMFNVKCTL